jgi:hypothetical protein
MKKLVLLIALASLSVPALELTRAATTATETAAVQEPSLLQRGALWLAEKAMNLQLKAVDKVKAMPASKDRDNLVLKMNKALDDADAQFETFAKQAGNNPSVINRINALRVQIATARRELPKVSTQVTENRNGMAATPLKPILP